MVDGATGAFSEWLAYIDWRAWMPLGIAGIVVWSIWSYRWIVSRTYRPVINSFRTTTSVVVPAFREDPDILLECFATWIEQNPTEILVVPDVEDTEVIARLREV